MEVLRYFVTKIIDKDLIWFKNFLRYFSSKYLSENIKTTQYHLLLFKMFQFYTYIYIYLSIYLSSYLSIYLSNMYVYIYIYILGNIRTVSHIKT